VSPNESDAFSILRTLPWIGSRRVAFWGAFAMAVTADIGKLFWHNYFVSLGNEPPKTVARIDDPEKNRRLAESAG